MAEYITEAGMEMEVAQAIKWFGARDADELFDLMKRRFEANHLQFNHTRLYAIVERQLADFRR